MVKAILLMTAFLATGIVFDDPDVNTPWRHDAGLEEGEHAANAPPSP